MLINNLNTEQQDKLQTLTQMIIHTDENKAEQATKNLALADTFTTQKAKISLLLELMRAASTHEGINNDEKNIIRAIAFKLDIPLQLLEEIEYWVELHSIPTTKTNVFMGKYSYH